MSASSAMDRPKTLNIFEKRVEYVFKRLSKIEEIKEKYYEKEIPIRPDRDDMCFLTINIHIKPLQNKEYMILNVEFEIPNTDDDDDIIEESIPYTKEVYNYISEYIQSFITRYVKVHKPLKVIRGTYKHETNNDITTSYIFVHHNHLLYINIGLNLGEHLHNIGFVIKYIPIIDGMYHKNLTITPRNTIINWKEIYSSTHHIAILQIFNEWSSTHRIEPEIVQKISNQSQVKNISNLSKFINDSIHP